MRIARCITKAADTHSECVILIAFPLLQGLRERASLLRLYLKYPSCLTQSQDLPLTVGASSRRLLDVPAGARSRILIFPHFYIFSLDHVVGTNKNASYKVR